MKYILLLTLLLGNATLFSQTSKAGNTRAVVIGISDYQNEAIPDLRYAHKDAEAFAKYLQSSAGGKLPDENIKLLINEEATTAAFLAELDWLVEESKEGDKAIIYFSGHGDVESKVARQPGFLLCYDSPPKIYMAGSCPLFYLQLIIETLSSDKNVQTLVITDACRAGKLAGSEIGGTQATAANLAKQYANEIKILSCQPDEFSLEGEQWGGGRGAFSYHLIEGLVGMADKNEDLKVNLLELENYLETVVPAETDPQSQIPMTIGSKGTKVAYVDEAILTELKSLKERQLPTLTAIESKGFEETLLAGVDSLLQKKHEDFITALDDDHLMDAQNGKPSADELYRELIQEESLKDLHRLMTRQLATALQDDAQQAINAYLLANPTELEKRWKGDTIYTQYPRYLGRAAELLGDKHYMHDYLIAKQLYFEGLNIRLNADQDNTSISYQEALKKQEAALALEDRAAYFYNELGVLHTRLKLSEKAVFYYEKAIELAPEWGLPYVNLCLEYFYNNEQEKAIETGDKAIEIMPSYPQLYNLVGWVNANYGGEYKDRRGWERRGVELKVDFNYSYLQVGTVNEKTIKLHRTIELLTKAIEIDSNYSAAHANLGPVYRQIDQIDKAEFHLKKATQLDTTNAFAYWVLGSVYRIQKKCTEGEIAYQKAIDLKMQDNTKEASQEYTSLGKLYKSCFGDDDKALSTYQKALKLYPESGAPHRACCVIYTSKNDFQKAEWHLLKYRNFYYSSPKTYDDLGRFYRSINRYEDAERMYLKAIEILPGYLYPIHELMDLAQEKGDRKAAFEWQEKLLEKEPNEPRMYLSSGQTAYLFKEFEKAEMHFQKAVQLDPSNEDNLNRIGYFYRFHSEFEKAKLCLIKAQEINPQVRYPYINLGFIHYDAGLEEEANTWLDAAWTNTHDPLVFYFKMDLSLYKEDYEKASQHLDSLISYNETYRALPEIIDALKSADYQRADLLIKAVPDSLENLRNYFQARVQTKLGHYKEALQLLGDQGDLIPYSMIMRDTFFRPLRELHLFQQELRMTFPEKFDDLDEFETKPLEVTPKYYVENCIVLGKHYESEGEQERANFLYEKALSLKSDTLTAEIQMNLAEACLKLNKYQQALENCPDSIQSEDAFTNFNYATLYYKLNRPEKAEEHFQQFTQLRDNAYRFQRVAVFYYLNSEQALMEKYVGKTEAIYPDNTGPYIGRGLMNASLGKYEAAMLALEKGIEKLPNENNLKIVKTFITATYKPSEASKALKELETIYPDAAKIGACIDLMKANKFEEARLAREELNEAYAKTIIPPLLNLPYVRMLVAQKDFSTAMDIIEANNFVLFPYHVLINDSALAPLRETERFKIYMQRNYPGK